LQRVRTRGHVFTPPENVLVKLLRGEVVTVTTKTQQEPTILFDCIVTLSCPVTITSISYSGNGQFFDGYFIVDTQFESLEEESATWASSNNGRKLIGAVSGANFHLKSSYKCGDNTAIPITLTKIEMTSRPVRARLADDLVKTFNQPKLIFPDDCLKIIVKPESFVFANINYSPLNNSTNETENKDNKDNKEQKVESKSEVKFPLTFKEIYVSKFMLSLRSEVFSAMFDGGVGMKESQERQVTITDFSCEVFEEFLRFIYTDQLFGRLKTPFQCVEMYAIADKYAMFSLKEMCQSQIRLLLNSNNVEIFVEAALRWPACKEPVFTEILYLYKHKIPDDKEADKFALKILKLMMNVNIMS